MKLHNWALPLQGSGERDFKEDLCAGYSIPLCTFYFCLNLYLRCRVLLKEGKVGGLKGGERAKTYRIVDRSISGSSGHDVVANLRRGGAVPHSGSPLPPSVEVALNNLPIMISQIGVGKVKLIHIPSIWNKFSCLQRCHHVSTTR